MNKNSIAFSRLVRLITASLIAHDSVGGHFLASVEESLGFHSSSARFRISAGHAKTKTTTPADANSSVYLSRFSSFSSTTQKRTGVRGFFFSLRLV